MRYRPYGRTGKDISVISAGGMRLKTPETDSDLDAGAEVLCHAYEQGINYFDTAPFYCGDRSEEIVGRAIKQMKPGTFYVSSKCAKESGDEFRNSLERSLQRLGVEQINFFHIWCLLRPSEWDARKRGGAIDEALKAKEEGLIEHLVFSTHMTGDQTAAIIDKGLFEGVTLGYNAINFPYRERAVSAAGEAEMGVVTMNPLGGGLIPQQAERFDFIRSEGDENVVEAALRFNMSHPAITSALVGFSSKDQVDQAVAIADAEPLTVEEVARVKNHIVDAFDGLCTGCGYCLPCPAGIPIPQYMDSFNMRILEGTDEAILMRLKWHWDIQAADAGQCVECGQCEEACTQHLPIVERLAQIAATKPTEQK